MSALDILIEEAMATAERIAAICDRAEARRQEMMARSL